MRYLGGKSKIRKQIAAFLESLRKPNQVYFEPFVGGGWVLQEMSGDRIASDGNKALIAMYQALQDGWVPPEFVSEEEYKQIKHTYDESSPMLAFCGFGCSFAGRWFGGYARAPGKDYFAATSKRSLLKQLPLIKDVEFVQGLYNEHSPEGMLIYCDPPYSNTTQYGAFSGFDHVAFWEKMREWSLNNTVVISEYVAPDDFVCVKEMTSQMGLSVGDKNNRPKRIEKLFMHKSQAGL
jgi:DNA adenine methylase